MNHTPEDASVHTLPATAKAQMNENTVRTPSTVRCAQTTGGGHP